MKKAVSILIAMLTLLSGCTLDNESSKPTQSGVKDESSVSELPYASEDENSSKEETSASVSLEETTLGTPEPETSETDTPAPETSEIIVPAPETSEIIVPAPETSEIIVPAPETTVSDTSETQAETAITTLPPTGLFDTFFSNFYEYEDNLPTHIISFHVREAYFNADKDFILVCYIYNPFDTSATIHKLNYITVSDANRKEFAYASFKNSFKCTIEPKSYYIHTFEFKAEEESIFTYDIDMSKISLSWEASYMRN